MCARAAWRGFVEALRGTRMLALAALALAVAAGALPEPSHAGARGSLKMGAGFVTPGGEVACGDVYQTDHTYPIWFFACERRSDGHTLSFNARGGTGEFSLGRRMTATEWQLWAGADQVGTGGEWRSTVGTFGITCRVTRESVTCYDEAGEVLSPKDDDGSQVVFRLTYVTDGGGSGNAIGSHAVVLISGFQSVNPYGVRLTSGSEACIRGSDWADLAGTPPLSENDVIVAPASDEGANKALGCSNGRVQGIEGVVTPNLVMNTKQLSLADNTARVENFLAHLKRHNPQLVSVDLVGHSMGGVIAVRLASNAKVGVGMGGAAWRGPQVRTTVTLDSPLTGSYLSDTVVAAAATVKCVPRPGYVPPSTPACRLARDATAWIQGHPTAYTLDRADMAVWNKAAPSKPDGVHLFAGWCGTFPKKRDVAPCDAWEWAGFGIGLTAGGGTTAGGIGHLVGGNDGYYWPNDGAVGLDSQLASDDPSSPGADIGIRVTSRVTAHGHHATFVPTSGAANFLQEAIAPAQRSRGSYSGQWGRSEVAIASTARSKRAARLPRPARKRAFAIDVATSIPVAADSEVPPGTDAVLSSEAISCGGDAGSPGALPLPDSTLVIVAIPDWCTAPRTAEPALAIADPTTRSRIRGVVLIKSKRIQVQVPRTLVKPRVILTRGKKSWRAACRRQTCSAPWRPRTTVQVSGVLEGLPVSGMTRP